MQSNFTTSKDQIEARQNLADHHPLLACTAFLPTQPIYDLYMAVKRVVALREVGGYSTARSGVGKTSAIDVVAMMLAQSMPGLVIHKYSLENQQSPSVRAFFKTFLDTIGHPNIKGETADLRLRVANRLIDDARRSGRNIVVLFIDEAQAMRLQDFLFLKDISNSLTNQSVQLIPILMAQEPDFQRVIRELSDKKRLDLIGRFAMRKIHFRGYNCLKDFQDIFAQIDTLDFPVDSGCTWTEFFLPKAFASGFRLLNESEKVFDILSNFPTSLKSDLECPARQLFLAIKVFFLDNARYDAEKFLLPKDAWAAALSYANVEEAMVLMKSSEIKEALRVSI